MELQEIRAWNHEKRCRQAVAGLTRRGFTALYCADVAEAAGYIMAQAGEAKTIGLGGSFSVKELGVAERLAAAGKEVLNHGRSDLTRVDRRVAMERQQTCDLFLAGTNALTLDGVLVNIDGIGNRVAAMIFGPHKVIVVAGRNKLVAGGVDQAIRRIKEWAAPPNAMRLGRDTPCAVSGLCEDCDSAERICRVTTVIEWRPGATDFHVLVVNADLGL